MEGTSISIWIGSKRLQSPRELVKWNASQTGTVLSSNEESKFARQVGSWTNKVPQRARHRIQHAILITC